MTRDISYRRLLSRMGYYDYQSRLIFRHLNQESGWDSHLDHCRNYILKAVDAQKPEKVTVLGSGWLLELPVAEIISRTGKLTLIDIIHPPEVIAQAGKIGNIELIESDLTGGIIEQVWNMVSRNSVFSKPKSLKEIKIPEFSTDSDPGMIISLNLVTQLETMLVSFLKKKARIDDKEMLEFRKTIQTKHLDFISKYKSVLITDCEEIITNKSGKVDKISTLLADLPLYSDHEEWTWNFDSKGVDFYNSRSVMRVLALTI